MDLLGALAGLNSRLINGGESSSGAGAGGASSNVNSSTSLSDFSNVIKSWEEGRSGSGFDPTESLTKLCEILEKEHDVYTSADPDPFEDRHPYRVDPDCCLGQLLKNFFRKESLVQDLFNNYLDERFWTRHGIDKNSFPLNVAASRLVLDILPGLQTSVLSDTEGLVNRLYSWAEKAEEPLRSYATGLLAVASELTEVATDPENREKNTKIVPILLKRLKEFQKEFLESKTELQSETTKDETNSNKFKRPFSIFSNRKLGPNKRLSMENEDSDAVMRSPDHGSSLNPGWPAAPVGSIPGQSPPRHIQDSWSNSSWAEMESQVICQFHVHPLTLIGKQVFILRLLAPLAEYQDFLTFTIDSGVLELISNYLNIKLTKDTRLAFEALKFLAGLFCHKKLVMEWVTTGGIQKLLTIPRPSIASTAVSQVLYYIGCDDDCMEKVCLLPAKVLDDLMTYALWLMECSHDSGKQFAVMFSYLSFSFKILLDIFDEKNGMRTIYNTINRLPILNQDEPIMLSDDQMYLEKQSVRQAMIAFKRYAEAHLVILSEQLRRLHTRDNKAKTLQTPIYKPTRLSPEQVSEQMETLMELMPFRARWPAIDKFVQLGGVTLSLKVIAVAYDWTFQGRAETVRSALECLAIAGVLPKVQLQFCERIKLPDETKVVGINILLCSAEGVFIQDSPESQRGALSVLINCVCAPIERSNNIHRLNSVVGSSVKKKSNGKTSSEEHINKIWDCVRSNNGIMVLLQLLHTKTPITDADSIRALACRALSGLARSSAANQIMSKLSIFTNGELQLLVREPVLQDKRGEHVKFQHYAHDLLELVSGPSGPRKLTGGNDFSLEMLHRASVVAQTKIKFSKKQLIQMIQEYLVSQGLSETASVLQREADIDLLTTKALHHNTTNTPVANRNRPNSLTSSPVQSTSRGTPSHNTPLSTGTTPTLRIHSRSSRKLDVNSPIPSLNITATPSTPSTSSELRPSMKLVPPVPPMPIIPDINNTVDCNNIAATETRNSLVSIVSDYLSSQHSLCKNPMSTCPEFDLFLPHKCPDPRPRNSAPYNFTTRYSQRQIFPPFGGPDGRKLDLKLMYGRFRPIKTFRPLESDSRPESNFTSCAIMPDDQFLLAGTYTGDVVLFNLNTGAEEATYNCHESQVHHIQPSRDGKFILTSSSWREPYSSMWSMGEFFESKMVFSNDDYVEFSKLTQDKVIGTADRCATIYDLSTNLPIRKLEPINSNNYVKNRATFDPTDELVLTDGVLYDLRMNKEIRKLDKLNQNLSGVFHPNGLEIVSNSEVWDIRTFHLLKTVPQLDQCQISFSNSGDIIYGVMLEQETEDGERYESSFKTLDASDYSSIATIETRRSVLDLCSSTYDLQIAVVENSSLMANEESVVRLYDVGRKLDEEEDYDEDVDEDKEDDEDGDDDDDNDYSDDSNDAFNDILGGSSDDDEDDEDDDEDDDDDNEDDVIENGDEEESRPDEGSNNSNGSWEDIEEEEVMG